MIAVRQRCVRVPGVWSVLAVVFFFADFVEDRSFAADSRGDYEKHIRPLLQDFCCGCHGGKDHAGRPPACLHLVHRGHTHSHPSRYLVDWMRVSNGSISNISGTFAGGAILFLAFTWSSLYLSSAHLLFKMRATVDLDDVKRLV